VPVQVPGSDEDAPSCRARLDLYAPGTRDFDAEPVGSFGCDAYTLFTPARKEAGLYVLRVSAPSFARGPQRFHLQVAPADASDTVPGLFLANHARAHGALRGSGVDRVDLYRFTVTQRSLLKLALSGGGESLTLRLRNDRGRPITSSEGGEIRRQLRPGRYYASVTAPAGVDAHYVLLRSSRAITRTGISISGRTVTVTVRPNATGTARATVERLDPEFGWQYARTVDVSVRGGHGAFGLGALTVGRWRVRAEYLGTGDAAPSASGFAQVLVT
jgi:hypothetical protein